jgi:GNAT superfamily N-acetyltransferase
LEGIKLIIRQATPKDITKVSQLWLYLTKEQVKDCCPNVSWWCDRIFRMMKTPDYFMLVAEEGDDILGFIDLILFDEPTDSKRHAVGQHFYVLPEKRGTKVSAKLWKTILDLIRDRVEVLDAMCGEKQQKFWEKRNFKQKFSMMQKVGVI